MIFLFEDRKDRMKVLWYNKDNSKILDTERAITVNKEKLESFFTEFENIDAILIHKSYKFPSNDVTIEDVKSICIKKEIPIAFFSGGLANAIIDENFVMCNSGDFYSNLNLFLNEFVTTKKINLPLLVFGRKYIINELKQLQIVVSRKIILREKVEIVDLKNLKTDIKIYLAAQELHEDKNILINWIDECITETEIEKKSIESKTILNKLQKLISNYANI